MTPDTILVEKPEDLNGFEFIDDNLITYDSDYWQWQQATKQIYDQMCKQHPVLEYRPYQYKYAAMFACRERNIMAWQMSSGKTITSAVMLAAMYRQQIATRRRACIHIVVPNALAAERWKEDLSLIDCLEDRYTVLKKENDIYGAIDQIVIYTYDFPKRKARRRNYEAISEIIFDYCPPETLIIDEVHGLKEKTQRTKHMKVLCDKANRVLVLSGTLSDGQLSRVHNICKLVYPEHWPFVSAKGMTQHLGTKQKVKTNYLTGTNNQGAAPPKYLQQLNVARMAEYYDLSRRFIHRLTLNDPDVEPYVTIPESETHVHIVDPHEKQYARYKNAIDIQRGVLQAIASSNGSANMRGRALQILQTLLAMCNWPGGIPITPKIAKVKQIIEAAEGRVIVFAHYVPAARRITEALSESFNTVRLFASDEQLGQKMGDDERVRVVNDFQYGADVKAGVFSINLANEAIDLTAASDVVYYDMTWQPIKLMQSMSRAVRPGNKHKKVQLHYVAHRGMIDEHQLYLMLEKVKGARLLLDYDMSAGLSGSLNPIDAIKRILNAN